MHVGVAEGQAQLVLQLAFAGLDDDQAMCRCERSTEASIGNGHARCVAKRPSSCAAPLPPIHLRVVRWWEDKTLAALVPKDADVKPVSPPSTGTCPTREGPRGPVAPVLDPPYWRSHSVTLHGPGKPHRRTMSLALPHAPELSSYFRTSRRLARNFTRL